MKKILLYGDSNLWGNDVLNFDPLTGVFPRFPREKRIVGVMEKLLPGYEIIEEGLCGRTTCLSEPSAPYRNGITYLPACLHSHEPLDLVIIMLGTNDMQRCFSFSAYYSASAMANYVRIIRSEFMTTKMPEILIVSPVELGPDVENKSLGICFDSSSVERIKELPGAYSEVAETYKCHFLDAAKYAKPGEKDDVHLTIEEAGKLAVALAEKVKEIFA